MTKHHEALALIDEKDVEIAAINIENKKLFEEGIAIMHDQAAENIMLKERVRELESARCDTCPVHPSIIGYTNIENENTTLKERVQELEGAWNYKEKVINNLYAENTALREALEKRDDISRWEPGLRD